MSASPIDDDNASATEAPAEGAPAHDVPATDRSAWDRPGGDADQPGVIPPAGWRQIVARVARKVDAKNVSMLAAALAFYGLLAIFPLLTGLVALFGLVFDRQLIREQSAELASILPAEAHRLIDQQLLSLVESDPAQLGFGLAVSLFLSLWAVSVGTQSMMRAVNLAYGETESRSWLHLRLLALLFTAGGLLFLIASMSLIAILPSLLEWLGHLRVPIVSRGSLDFAQRLLAAVRWPLLAAVVVVALAFLYRYAPDRRLAKWRWVTWGGVAATALWLAASFLFAWYVEHFSTYNETYGALGGVVVLLLWLYLGAFAVLLGALINAETEHQTVRDSTVAPERPFGERGAVVADTTPAKLPPSDDDG